MRQEYNKLVRDRIPELIRLDGKECLINVLPDIEFRQALLDKLVEEAQEASQSDPVHLLIELADLSEVIDAVLIAFDISREQVVNIQNQRRRERGGFEKRLKLIWTEK